MPALPLSAAILAGGKSSRMGRDKALLEVGGQQVIDRVIKAVQAVSNNVMIIGNRPDFAREGVRMIPDDAAGFGPLGGIATALRHAHHDFVLVVACDMPLLSSNLLMAMAGEPRSYQALVPRLVDTAGRPRNEPLLAIYSVSCLPVIDGSIAAGETRVQNVFRHLDLRVLDAGWLRNHDRHLDSFINMNTPADLQRVRQRLGDQRESG